jgi:hypothetical protein
MASILLGWSDTVDDYNQITMTILRIPSLKAAALCVSGALFSSLAAQAQIPPENLVFFEQSSQVVTESLNGVPIGNWQVLESIFAPEYLLENSSANGNLENISSAGSAGLDFLDPLVPGNFFFYNKTSDVIGTDVPGSVINGDFYPLSGVSDFLPFSATGAEVVTANGLIPVNITVEGPAVGTVPDASSSSALLLTVVSALGLAKKSFSRRERQGSI